MSYQGWSNYETWCVSLWIDNDEGLQSYWQEQAEEIVNGQHESTTHGPDSYSDAACSLATMLKDDFEENAPTLEGFWSDLLNSALSEVEWREVAESIVGNVEVEEPEESEAA
jgi:hypothetical protein